MGSPLLGRLLEQFPDVVFFDALGPLDRVAQQGFQDRNGGVFVAHLFDQRRQRAQAFDGLIVEYPAQGELHQTREHLALDLGVGARGQVEQRVGELRHEGGQRLRQRGDELLRDAKIQGCTIRVSGEFAVRFANWSIDRSAAFTASEF